MSFKSKVKASIQNIIQLVFTERAMANKEIVVLGMPQRIEDDASATPYLVNKGSLLRIKGATGGFVVFGDDSAAMPNADVSEPTAIETPNDFFHVVATGQFIKTSAAMRIEVIE